MCFAKALVSVVEDMPALFDLKTDGLMLTGFLADSILSFASFIF